MRGRRRKQSTPERQRRHANRRNRLFRAAGRVLFIGILLAAAVLALTVFFRVNTISVEGSVRYSAEEIVAGMDVKQGDNLYLWNKVKVSDELLRQFPYLETVQIRRHLPDALVVTVTECTATVAVPSDGGYYYLSEQGKVLEQNAADGGLPLVTGVTLSGLTPGQMVRQAEDAYADALLEILQTMDAGGMLEGLDFINLQDLTDIRIGYDGRFDIRVGTVDELAYRLRFAKTVIDERLSPSDIGRLYWDKDDRLHFVPDTAESVAASATGTETIAGSAPVDLSGSDGSTDGEASGDGAADDGAEDTGEASGDSGYDETGDETAE